VDTQIRDHACPSVGILSDSHGDAASPHQYCGHFLAFRIVLRSTDRATSLIGRISVT